MADFLDPALSDRLPLGLGGRFYGVYPALVTSNQDPEGLGRVRVKLPWAPDGSAEYNVWARLCVPFAGAERGVWFIPDQDDEVLVSFAAGDPRFPFVVGSLWNGSDKPPETMDSQNKIKSIQTRAGVKITLDDSAGQCKLKLETPGGQSVLLKDGPGGVEIEDANGNQIFLEPQGISIKAAGPLTIDAATITMTAGQLTVNAGMSTFSGVVQANTVITNSVVSASYTPGAGNVW